VPTGHGLHLRLLSYFKRIVNTNWNARKATSATDSYWPITVPALWPAYSHETPVKHTFLNVSVMDQTVAYNYLWLKCQYGTYAVDLSCDTFHVTFPNLLRMQYP
jgi:hypothetical protein